MLEVMTIIGVMLAPDCRLRTPHHTETGVRPEDSQRAVVVLVGSADHITADGHIDHQGKGPTF